MCGAFLTCRDERLNCFSRDGIRKIGDVSSAKPPITRRQRETPGIPTIRKMSARKSAIFLMVGMRKPPAWLPTGFEALLPYLRRILILSKWERGTAHVMGEIPGIIFGMFLLCKTNKVYRSYKERNSRHPDKENYLICYTKQHMIPQKEKIFLSVIGLFFAILAVWVVAAVMTAPPRDNKDPGAPYAACTEETMLCPDGSAVGRTGPNCEFAPCPPLPKGPKPIIVPEPQPVPTPIGDDGGENIACTMDAKMCPDGSYVGRTAPKCEFAPCPTSPPEPISGTSGSCTSDSDCAVGYSCEDISPVVREGTQNLRCWKNGAPRPICLSGETHIATPSGDIVVKNMKGGEVVWSINAKGEKIAVPLLLASHTEAPLNHHVVHLVLADGRELFVSSGHPVADGRTVGSLKKGDVLAGSIVLSAALVSYNEPYTYDILPDSDTGMYWANGILLQSTLKN
jgi:hypothetical protein